MLASRSARSATAPCRPGDRALLLQPIGYAVAVADAITPDLLPRPTPCQGWDLRKLLRHANESLAALLEAVGPSRVSPFPAAEEPGADLAGRSLIALADSQTSAPGPAVGTGATCGAGQHRHDQAWAAADLGISLLAAIGVPVRLRRGAPSGADPSLTGATLTAAVTAIGAADAVLSSRKNQELAEVTMVAEAARRALFRPPPSRLGAAAACRGAGGGHGRSRVGGDLYEAAARHTGSG